MDPLTVAVTTDVYDDATHVKGVANYVRYLTRELAAADTPHQYRTLHFEASAGDIYGYGLPDVVLPRVGFPMEGVSKLLTTRFRARDALADLDVLHTTAPRLYYFPLYTPEVSNVLTVHAMDLHIPPELRAHPLEETHAWVQQRLLGWYFERAREHIDAIITVSEFLKRELVEHLDVPPEKIHPVHLAPDERFERTDDEPSRDVILSDTPEAELIDVYYRLRREGLEHDLVIFSMRGYGYEAAKRRVETLGLEEFVDFRGYVSDDELVELYNEAAVYVRIAAYEGFGLPPIEAMACGCPVVTTDVGSLPEVVGDAGIMKPYVDVDGFVDAVHGVLTDDEERQAMVQRGLERAERFSWERTARETIEVYESVAGE